MGTQDQGSLLPAGGVGAVGETRQHYHGAALARGDQESCTPQSALCVLPRGPLTLTLKPKPRPFFGLTRLTRSGC